MAKINPVENSNPSTDKTHQGIGKFLSHLSHNAYQVMREVGTALTSTCLFIPTTIRRNSTHSAPNYYVNTFPLSVFAVAGAGMYGLADYLYRGIETWGAIQSTNPNPNSEALIALGAAVVATNVVSGLYELCRYDMTRAAGGLEDRMETPIEPKK